MKNRSKMILGLASMLGISAGVSAVSGFAWFTTQRTAQIDAAQFKVGASEGSLTISATGTPTNCTATVSGSVQTVAIADDAVLADVSSCDGTNFFKAKLGANGNLSSIVKETSATSSVNTSQMNYVSWDLQVKNDAANTKLDVYLSNNGKIFSENGAVETTSLLEFVANGTQTDFIFDGIAESATGIKVNGVADTTGAALNDAKNGIHFNSAPTAGAKITATVDFDYSQFYRLVIIDTNNSNKIVFRYTHSKHLSYLKATTESNLNGTGTLTAAVEKDANADAGTTLYAETEATVCTINSNSDITAHEYSTTAEAGNQLLVKDLISTQAHTLKFVVWCEGTATPEAAVATANKVKMNLGLVGLTATAQA